MSVAPILAALGDDSRLRIVQKLCTIGPLSTTKLAQDADITRQAIAKHMQALSKAGLVRSARSGRERIWELRPQRLEEVRRYLERISKRWDDALGRLKAAVEE